jgi:hypothetical protein
MSGNGRVCAPNWPSRHNNNLNDKVSISAAALNASLCLANRGCIGAEGLRCHWFATKVRLLNETDAAQCSGRKQLVVGLNPKYLLCFALYAFTRVAGRAGAVFRTNLAEHEKCLPGYEFAVLWPGSSGLVV